MKTHLLGRVLGQLRDERGLVRHRDVSHREDALEPEVLG